MISRWLRSTLFNLSFYLITSLMCIVFLPAFLLPRKAFLAVVTLYMHMVSALEKYIMGITYEIRGSEHLPDNGGYIIAAKHQSAYETLKLRFLFNDPAIVLKKELLRIPFWGLYLKKSGVIAIDRATPKTALRSTEEGALEMKKQGRPIVIFPQGTRVKPGTSTDEKPYKAGVVRIQSITGLPIIPMALNSGLFWPKGGWLKTSGKVIFEFLPPIAAETMERAELMKNIETRIESASDKLMQESIS